MALPDRISIRWLPDYHTDTIGTYAEGQFYLMFRGARTGDPTIEGPWRGDRPGRWLVYLHLFDHDGNHRSTAVHVISASSEPMTETDHRHGEAVLALLLSALDAPTFGDIAIRLFRVDLDDIVFGLVDESDPERGHWAELYPDGFGFCPPWDGDYST